MPHNAAMRTKAVATTLLGRVIAPIGRYLTPGFNVLEWLRSHTEFSELPTVVISSSGDVSDVEKARDLGAADYLPKPTRFADLTAMVKELQRNWLQSAVQTP